MLYTLIKKEYSVYFPLINIVHLLKKHKIYPLHNLYPELFEELLKQDEDQYNYFFLKEYLYEISEYITYIIDKEEISSDDNDPDFEFFLEHLTGIAIFFKNEKFINDVINDPRFSYDMAESIKFIIWNIKI